MRIIRIILLFCFFLIPAFLFAGEEYLGDFGVVLITPRSIPTDISKLTRKVTVLDKEEIKNIPADSISEVLNYVSGTDIQNRSLHGVQSDISIRGSTFQQTLILIDGIRVNDPQTAHHNMDLPISLNDVERIEILHGHGSSLYGSDAFGGVINIITKECEEDMTFGFSLGQYNTRQGFLSFGRKLGKFSSRFSVEKKKSDGFRYDTHFDIFNVSDKFTFEAFDAKFDLHLGLMNKNFGAFDFYTPGKNMPSEEWTETYFVNLQALKEETPFVRDRSGVRLVSLLHLLDVGCIHPVQE